MNGRIWTDLPITLPDIRKHGWVKSDWIICVLPMMHSGSGNAVCLRPNCNWPAITAGRSFCTMSVQVRIC